jgi:hypothetical protein
VQPISAKRLAKAVIEMRKLQTEARRLKTRAAFARSGQAERGIDEMCERVMKEREQGILWDQP